MIQNRYSVIADTDSQDEYSYHFSLEKAEAQADAYAKEYGIPFRVDLNVMEGKPGAFECIDSTPDLYSTLYAPSAIGERVTKTEGRA